jgi:hypothetical protein
LFFTDKKIDYILPCFREIVTLGLIDNLRDFNLGFIALEARNLDILLIVEFHFNKIPGRTILSLNVGI